jgi:hypothetical protein
LGGGGGEWGGGKGGGGGGGGGGWGGCSSIRYGNVMDLELQQRAVEYAELCARPQLARDNVLPMPQWEKRRSLLLRRLEKGEVGGPLCTADGSLTGRRPTFFFWGGGGSSGP